MTLVADLLSIPPADARAWLVQQPEQDVGRILADFRREVGTSWALWRDDPVGFVHDVLGGYMTERQRQVLEALQSGDPRRVAAVSAHGVGKSRTAARALVWWIATRGRGARAISTAPTYRQVRHILWAYIHGEHREAGLLGRLNLVEWMYDDIAVAYGFSPSKHDESAIQGIHADDGLLIIVDEAGGIPASLGRNLDSLMTGDARMLAIGNPPTDVEGSWLEQIAGSPLWKLITITAWDSPNFCDNPDCEDPATGYRTAIDLHGDPCPTCGTPTEPCPHDIARNLVGWEWVNDAIVSWGADDPYVIARVDAQFPKSSSRRVIPPMWVDPCIWGDREGEEEQDPTLGHSDWIRFGVDVASDGGDEMVIAVMDGWEVSILDHWSGADSADQVLNAERIAEWIQWAEALHRRRRYTEHAVRVKIDALGIGAGTADELERLKRDKKSEYHHTADIVKVKVSERPKNPRYYNQRAEAWWEFRDLCRKRDVRLRIPADGREYKQLTVPTFKDAGPGGRIVIESKGDLRSRGMASPDRADAMLLAPYEPVTVVKASSFGEAARKRRPPARVGQGQGTGRIGAPGGRLGRIGGGFGVDH